MLLEICAGSLTSAINAQTGGAHRIELCHNLSEGGTTPSPGAIVQVKKLLSIPVFVLIRPRPGDFLYTSEEFESMREDIRFCRELGIEGVVLGILKREGEVDIERTRQLIELARPMQVTFHRAFDMTRDPFDALEDIMRLGCDRILTSGQAASASDGADLISALIKKATDRINIMPGGGITESNVASLIQQTAAREVHASLRSPFDSQMHYRNDRTSMGQPGSAEYSRLETDPERIKKMISLLNSF